jgi:hypothetical protein
LRTLFICTSITAIWLDQTYSNSICHVHQVACPWTASNQDAGCAGEMQQMLRVVDSSALATAKAACRYAKQYYSKSFDELLIQHATLKTFISVTGR